MIDYQLFNTLEDHILPHSLVGNYHYHLFCKSGAMSFMRKGKILSMRPGDLLIWQKPKSLSDFSYSKDFEAELLMVSSPFLNALNPERHWAAIGYMFITSNPVFHLDQDGMKILATDIRQFRHRMNDSMAVYGDDRAKEMMKVLLYDIWHIYSREIVRYGIDDDKSEHLLRFLMLAQEYTPEQREVSWYAAQLGITPKYLTEISNDFTGRPAGDWIDNFVAPGLRKLLSNDRLTLSDIIEQLHFSHHSAFTRYVKRLLGTAPSALQQSHLMNSGTGVA